MIDTIRATLAELQQAAARLDAILAAAGGLPALHTARLTIKLADMADGLATLVELTEQLAEGPSGRPSTRQERL